MLDRENIARANWPPIVALAALSVLAGGCGRIGFDASSDVPACPNACVAGSTIATLCLCDMSTNAVDARDQCAAVGRLLVRIDDEAENDAVRADADNANVSAFWIGASDDLVEDEWRWSDGELFWQGDETGAPVAGLYNRWRAGQPDGGGPTDCTRMELDGQWADSNCVASLRSFVCEFY